MTTFPQLNINGTSGQQLLDDNLVALQALREARKAMLEASPHGRDYQTLPQGTFQRAQDEARFRLQKLDTLMGDYALIVDDLSAQLDKRLARHA